MILVLQHHLPPVVVVGPWEPSSSHLYASMIPEWTEAATTVQARATQYQANKVDKHKLNADQRHGVIIIIWHQVCPVIGFTVLSPHLLVQAGSEPIHFPYVVQSFPHFSLGAVSSLVCILEITEDNCLKAWNPLLKHWETHVLTTSHQVVEQQRLLYKLVKNVTTLFDDTQCPGLEEEMAQQLTIGKRQQNIDGAGLPVGPAPMVSLSLLPKHFLNELIASTSLLESVDQSPISMPSKQR